MHGWMIGLGVQNPKAWHGMLTEKLRDLLFDSWEVPNSSTTPIRMTASFCYYVGGVDSADHHAPSLCCLPQGQECHLKPPRVSY